MTNSTDALQRAWAQFIFDTFVTSGGWVQTADTGQVTISTISHATVANTYQGYHVYRMNDTLQATAPLFIKVEFGASSASANAPAIRMTFGTGSDGAGNITGILLNQIIVQSALNATNATSSYGSADTNRCHFMLFVRNAATDSILFSVERTHDPVTGADTAAGFLITYQDTTPGTVTQYLNSAFGAQPSGERWTVVISNNATSTFGSNTGVGFPLHFKGIVQPVALGVIVVNQNDFIAAGQPVISVYGTNHQYQLADSANNAMSVAIGNAGAGSAGSRRFGIRYE